MYIPVRLYSRPEPDSYILNEGKRVQLTSQEASKDPCRDSQIPDVRYYPEETSVHGESANEVQILIKGEIRGPRDP